MKDETKQYENCPRCKLPKKMRKDKDLNIGIEDKYFCGNRRCVRFAR